MFHNNQHITAPVANIAETLNTK